MAQTKLFKEQEGIGGKKVINVSKVPQRSPFRFPGGKTWLIPVIRKWLMAKDDKKILYEPFLGGGIVSLTAAAENLVDKCLMSELDDEISAVWEQIINHDHKVLADKIADFDLTPENINLLFIKNDKSNFDVAFNTILKNRTFHGGIITKGSGLIKNGEKGKGIRSRWYPETLYKRIMNIGTYKNKLSFERKDAFKVLEENLNESNAYFFIDPPYTVAGKRLYTHHNIDHDNLFKLTSQISGNYMLTYDNCDEVRDLASKYKLDYRVIPMKTTHHIQKNEIVVSNDFSWWD